MTNEIVPTGNQASIIESVVIGGDLSKLTPDQRVAYYQATCKSLGLNPLTKPFDYITLNGRLTLYAKRDATDQLRKNYSVSIIKLDRETVSDIYLVTAYAKDKTGRTDSSIGAVNIGNVKGDALANAIMKAETKAKRRVTLSICGLGVLDETEIETIPSSAIQYPENMQEDPSPIVSTSTKQEQTTVQKSIPTNAAPLVRAFIENDIAEKVPEAAAIINKLHLSGDPTPEKISLGKIYRGWRDIGKEPAEAAELTLGGEAPK